MQQSSPGFAIIIVKLPDIRFGGSMGSLPWTFSVFMKYFPGNARGRLQAWLLFFRVVNLKAGFGREFPLPIGSSKWPVYLAAPEANTDWRDDCDFWQSHFKQTVFSVLSRLLCCIRSRFRSAMGWGRRLPGRAVWTRTKAGVYCRLSISSKKSGTYEALW